VKFVTNLDMEELMGQDEKLTHKKLSQLWADKEIEVLKTVGQKYVVMSDLHMGDGGQADDLRHNKDTLKRALEHYKNKGFKLILLGDIEELWQFDLEEIERTYGKDIYARMRRFGKGNVYRVYGNHDKDWILQDPLRKEDSDNRWAVEALKMKGKDGRTSILLIHGHQGSVESDKYSWISRVLVKKAFKPVEGLAKTLKLYGHSTAKKSQIAKNYEKSMYSWAKKNKVIIICGHSHRAIYASISYMNILKDEIRKLQSDILAHNDDKRRIKKNIKKIDKLTKELAGEKLKGREIDRTEKNKTPLPCYFNCGCGLFKDGMTTLEIENDITRLVKWHRKPKRDRFFKIYQDGNGKTLSDFIKTVKS
jgi:UDP-2,3-diacylglucosamine pyrophosphatase LpxH